MSTRVVELSLVKQQMLLLSVFLIQNPSGRFTWGTFCPTNNSGNSRHASFNGKKNSENILLEKYWDKPVGWSLSYVYGNLEMLFHLPPNISKFWIKKLPKIPFIIPPPLPKKTSNNKPLTLS